MCLPVRFLCSVSLSSRWGFEFNNLAFNSCFIRNEWKQWNSSKPLWLKPFGLNLPSEALPKDSLESKPSVNYMRCTVISFKCTVCFERKRDCRVIMKRCDYNILSTHNLSTSRSCVFPRKLSSYSGNMWKLCSSCHACLYKYHQRHFHKPNMI